MSELLHEYTNLPQGSLAEWIPRERERLLAERERIYGMQQELKQEFDSIDREFAAIEAYEAAKAGKTQNTTPGIRRRPGPQKDSMRKTLADLIGQSPGLKRGEILERMGLKGDKSGEMSVSNALTALTKRNEVRREGGKYLPAETVHEGASEQQQRHAAE